MWLLRWRTDIVGIRFALDIHGLRAIRVKYSDKSMSPWLGNPGAAWYGDTPGSGTELRRLQLFGDVGTFQTHETPPLELTWNSRRSV